MGAIAIILGAVVGVAIAGDWNNSLRVLLGVAVFAASAILGLRLDARRKARTGSAPASNHPLGSTESEMQLPDQFGQRGRLEYGNGRFIAAAQEFATAIDKLHTMYVPGEMRARQPSTNDTYIVEGFGNSLGAARAMDPTIDLSQLETKAAHYLKEIAEAASGAGYDPNLYEKY